MLTWLDEWCSGMRFRRLELLQEQGLPRDENCRNDALAAREGVFDGLQARLKLDERGEEVPLALVSLSMIAPFFFPPREGAFVRAWQVTNELAQLLEEVELTAESVRRTRAAVDPYLSIYIDVPSGVIQLEEDVELRAIFVQPTEIRSHAIGANRDPPQDFLTYSAVLAPKGEYSWRKAVWSDDRTQLIVDNNRFSSPPESDMPTFDELLYRANWSHERFQDEVERLAYLVIEHAEDPERIVAENLPHMAAENARRTPGRGDVAERFSLFKVQRLLPRVEARAKRTNLQPRASWRLGRRITVSPHLRTIRVPSTGEIREVKVRAHQKGPIDGLPIHPIVRL